MRIVPLLDSLQISRENRYIIIIPPIFMEKLVSILHSMTLYRSLPKVVMGDLFFFFFEGNSNQTRKKLWQDAHRVPRPYG